MVKNPKERITLEAIQKTAWYNKGFESEAPRKYTPITVTQDQLAGAVLATEVVVEMHDAPAASADAAAPSGAPTYVCGSPINAFAGFKNGDCVVNSALICCRLNAFDLINLVGGLALDNLFNYHKGSHVSWKYVPHMRLFVLIDSPWRDLPACMPNQWFRAKLRIT